MDVSLVLNNLGALVTSGLGAMALIRPSAAAAFASIRPEGLLGVSEIRATYGGLFAALGAYAILCQRPEVFAVAGVAWIGAALGRTLSVAVDRNAAPKNLGGIAFEAAIGFLLLAP